MKSFASHKKASRIQPSLPEKLHAARYSQPTALVQTVKETSLARIAGRGTACLFGARLLPPLPAPPQGVPSASGMGSRKRSSANPVAELHRLRFSSMLAADAQLQVLPRVERPLANGGLQQLANPFLIQHCERVLLEDSLSTIYAGRNWLMSSREIPKVVCVRSLVPKLKNSASFAI